MDLEAPIQLRDSNSSPRWLLFARGVLACSLLAGFACSADEGGSSAADPDGGTSLSDIDFHCEKGALDEDCVCIVDTNDVWTEEEGISTCTSEDPQAICCAQSTYPTSGSCQCQEFGCFESDATCRCSYSDTGATACARPWAECCALLAGSTVLSCSCTNRADGCSGANEVPVSSCSGATLGCLSASDFKIDRCSP